MSTFNFVLFHGYPLSVCVACSETQRQCRWDRHDQPHNTRDYFHPLPDAATDAAVDRGYATDLTRVIEETVLPWVGERVGALWESGTIELCGR